MANENTLNKIQVIATYELKINSGNFTVCVISNDISWDSSQKSHLNSVVTGVLKS